jgi:hypothetical protein
MCPGVDPASKIEYQDTPGGKDGRCVRVTTLRIPRGLFRPVAGKTLPLPYILYVVNELSLWTRITHYLNFAVFWFFR